MWFDTHCHLNRDELWDDIDDILRMIEEEKGLVNCVSYDLESSKRALEIARMSQRIMATVGVHPDDASNYDHEALIELVQDGEVVAVGECGFDFFRTPKEEVLSLQEEVFRKQIEIAIEYDKPVMVHTRCTKGTNDAYQEALRVLLEYPLVRPNFHFFVGSREMLEVILERGYGVSYTGVITFVDDYEELVRMTPLRQMMIETDAPWVAPKPYRGKTNMPWYVKEVGRKVAEIKDIKEEEVTKALWDRSRQFFGLK